MEGYSYTHTPLTQRSRSRLTMLFRRGVGTHQGNEVASSSSGNVCPQSSLLAVPLWTESQRVELMCGSWSKKRKKEKRKKGIKKKRKKHRWRTSRWTFLQTPRTLFHAVKEAHGVYKRTSCSCLYYNVNNKIITHFALSSLSPLCVYPFLMNSHKMRSSRLPRSEERLIRSVGYLGCRREKLFMLSPFLHPSASLSYSWPAVT